MMRSAGEAWRIPIEDMPWRSEHVAALKLDELVARRGELSMRPACTTCTPLRTRT